MTLEHEVLDLTNKGQRIMLGVPGSGRISVGTPMPGVFGSAVVEIKKMGNGVVESFATPQTLTSSSQVVSDLNAAGLEGLVAEVTTPDSSAGSVPIFVSTYPP